MNSILLFPFVLVSAISDLRTRRIPNTLILCGLIGAVFSRFALLPDFSSAFSVCGCLPGAGISPVVSSVPFTISSLADGCVGFLLPWIILGPLAALKMIGGGDVKLLSVIGLQLGAAKCLSVLWYSLVISALWSFVLVIRRRNLSRRLLHFYRYLGQVIASGKVTSYRESGADPSGEFCLALPVLIAFSIRLSFPG